MTALPQCIFVSVERWLPDDELTMLGAEPRFRVRETAVWKKHAATQLNDLQIEHAVKGTVS
jgi:hypothetical protein